MMSPTTTTRLSFIRWMRCSRRSRVSGAGGGLIAGLPGGSDRSWPAAVPRSDSRCGPPRWSAFTTWWKPALRRRSSGPCAAARPSAARQVRSTTPMKSWELARPPPAVAGKGSLISPSPWRSRVSSGVSSQRVPRGTLTVSGELVHVVEVAADPDAGVGEVLERVERAEGQARGLGVERAPARARGPAGRSRPP